MGTLGLAATELTLLPPLYINRMVRAKAKMSYQDNGDENGAGSEGESYQGGDSEEEFSDAPPAKKKKTSAKKKMKKAKKEKKKSKHTDDSDEDDIVAEVSEDDTAPATWRPGGPVVEGSKKYVYKDASDQDFTDDGEIDDAADSDFDAGAKAPPKKRSPKKTPAKKSPAKKGKKKTPAKKTPAKKGKGKKAATNGTTPRASGRASAKIKYAEEDEDDEEEEDEEDFEDEVPLKARKVAKQAKGRATAKEKEPEIPPVAEMVPTAIRALRDNPRKGSSLSAIKGFMAEEWGINIQTYAPRIKKYILKSVENGELLQTKGKGAAGRFTVPGLKARKKKGKSKKLSKKFDEDVVEYEPGKSARDEAREQTEMELAERRARLEEEAARKIAEKEMKPKKPRPAPKTDWVVSCIKGMKIAQEKTWYQVKWEDWAKTTWEPEENLQGCQEAIDNFLVEEKTRLRMEEERRKREEDEGHYEVGRITEVKFRKDGSREFLIRWKGHGPDVDSWEPEENLDCPEKIEKFMEIHERVLNVSEKTLRIAPKKVERLAFGNFKGTSRNRKGFRKTYEDMDASDNDD